MLPEGVLGEVRIHQHIYELRPAVNAICRIMPPNVMTLSTQHITPKCRHGLSAYFANDIPLWEDPSLLRNDLEARKLAQTMGERPAIIMRGNGAVIAGHSLEEAVTFSWFLEDTARVETAIRESGFDATEGLLIPEEISARQVTSGRVFERMWRHLTHGDPEEQLLLDNLEDEFYSASTLFV
jgi:HCOMODA/2-hydroxy-3-carboxy-muconic semialdehyde decarboxylase